MNKKIKMWRHVCISEPIQFIMLQFSLVFGQGLVFREKNQSYLTSTLGEGPGFSQRGVILQFWSIFFLLGPDLTVLTNSQKTEVNNHNLSWFPMRLGEWVNACHLTQLRYVKLWYWLRSWLQCSTLFWMPSLVFIGCMALYEQCDFSKLQFIQP